MRTQTDAIIHTLQHAPLLAEDLPRAPQFDRAHFVSPTQSHHINLDQKLGHIYEDALEILIQESPSLSLTASHVQIFDHKKRTLGELDFILRDHNANTNIHLELAIKFYCALKSKNGWSFPGPNQNDTWQRKINHMKAHQIPLGHSELTRHILRKDFNIDTLESRQLVYGCLFTPLKITLPSKPQHMSPSGTTGQWLYASEWDTHFSNMSDVMIIPKPFWPVTLSSHTEPFLEQQSVQTLMNMAQIRCTMFTVKGTNQKYFLMPENWGKKIN